MYGRARRVRCADILCSYPPDHMDTSASARLLSDSGKIASIYAEEGKLGWILQAGDRVDRVHNDVTPRDGRRVPIIISSLGSRVEKPWSARNHLTS
jgi:hypothetical protein